MKHRLNKPNTQVQENVQHISMCAVFLCFLVWFVLISTFNIFYTVQLPTTEDVWSQDLIYLSDLLPTKHFSNLVTKNSFNFPHVIYGPFVITNTWLCIYS